MESWRRVFREGIAPLLPVTGLQALHDALVKDDPALIQGATCSPPPIACAQNIEVEGGCGISYPLWKGECLNRVGELEDRFSEICYYVGVYFKEPAACRWFLNWFDETPRFEVLRLLLPEVKRSLAARLDPAPRHAANSNP
jgi:hypothetical protein